MEQSKFYQIKNVTEHEYTLVGCDGSVITRPIQDVDKSASSFTIQDAKDGDVLVLNDEVFIYAHRKQLYSIAVAHCFVDSTGGFHFDGEFGHTEEGNSIHPATKEQRDTLEKAMADAGYIFDFEKKELKKIEQGPAWSKEDEYRTEKLLGWINTLINYIHEDAIVSLDLRMERIQQVEQIETWLKSLKERVQPQKQWKPTKEQMKALTFACIKNAGIDKSSIKALYDLKEQLKQL